MMQTERNTTGPACVFINALISLNRLDAIGFSRLVFVPGMLFDRSQTWWPGGGLRPVTHEGLDICTFETIDGRDCRLDETTRIPVAFDGKIVGRCDDFLGETIIVHHFLPEPGAPSAYAFYAHILQDRDLSIGDFLSAGQTVGRIAPAGARKSAMPPHLHLTFARADLLPPVEQLKWPLLNRLERGVFCDPLQILPLPCRIMPDAGGMFDPNRYTACRTVAVTKANRSRA